MGAFYTVARIPVDDADKFCAWLLSDFEYENQTIFMAPASGFYTTPGYGKDEVRIAYVLKKEDLAISLKILEEALKVYPGSKVRKAVAAVEEYEKYNIIHVQKSVRNRIPDAFCL